MATTMRLATAADLPWVAEMMEVFNREELVPWSRATGEPALGALVADRSLGVVAVLDDGAGPIGYFVLTWGYDLEWNGRDAFLTELYLVPPSRGRGHGRDALELVLATARQHGARAVHLMVRAENAPARRLYASAGFTSPPRILLTKALAEPA